MIDTPVLERVLGEALRHGGEFAEVFAEDRSTSSALLDDGRVEELSSGRERGAGIRVVSGETTGFAHTADLSEAGLLRAAEAASAVARGGGGGTGTVAVSLAPIPRRAPPKRRTAKASPRAAGLQRASLDLLRRADEAARASDAAITQVQAGCGGSRRQVLIANSEGLYARDEQARTRFSVSCVASATPDCRPGSRRPLGPWASSCSTRSRWKSWPLWPQSGPRPISARPAPSGELPVVLAGGSGGILFHEACGHGLEADHIVKDASVYTGMVGQQVASPLVTLVDDGTVGSEWGTFAVDDEGRPAQRNVLIENGILTDYLWDYLRARKEGRLSSGNGRRQTYQHLPMVRMTNTFLLPGTEDADEIVAQTPRGVYVAKLGGGQVNTTTGDFVFGTTEAYLIEGGRITEPLRDANLIGNGPEILKRIDAVATDFGMTPGTCGKDGQSVPVGCGQATMRLTGVTIGGTAE